MHIRTFFLLGSGMVIEVTIDLYDEQEKVHYCRMVSKSFVRGYGGWNVSVKFKPKLRDINWNKGLQKLHCYKIGTQGT